jgi:glycosidase
MNGPRSDGHPPWVDHAIWWQVYPLGFCDAPIRDQHPEPGHRLRRLLDWLDHAVQLGANGLLLGPVFESQTHGYDTLDLYRIDPRLGTDEDFDDLVAACRSRGLRVGLDGVFSHVGDRHPLLAAALEGGRGSGPARLFDIDWDHPGGPVPRVWEGHGSLVRLDHGTAETADYVAGVMAHWLDRGADAWRLDAAYSVEPAFWASVLPRVRADHPDAWFLGEVIRGDYPQFVADSTVDSVTQYELWKAIWSSLKDGNLFELDWALRRHEEFLDRFTPTTFVGNHDVTRITSTLGPRLAVVALAVLLTVGGIPSIYYGDELGLLGIKRDRAEGDDQVRPAFPPHPEPLSPAAAAIYRAHQDLIGLRRRHSWLTTATTETVDLANDRYHYQARSRDGGDQLTVEIDLAEPEPVTISGSDGEVLWTGPKLA